MREISRWRERDGKEEHQDDSAGREKERENEGSAWWCDERWWTKMVVVGEERRMEKMKSEREKDVRNEGLIFYFLFFLIYVLEF